jgi:hypothetical protein
VTNFEEFTSTKGAACGAYGEAARAGLKSLTLHTSDVSSWRGRVMTGPLRLCPNFLTCPSSM